jgi:hypothetical protein
MIEKPAKLTIYTFRDDLAEDLLALQRAFICAEEVIERLQTHAQQLTIQKQCSLQQTVFEGGKITHFNAQRQLLLLQDRVAIITASFQHGKLATLKNEATNYITF